MEQTELGRISLNNAALCLCQGVPFVPDNVCEIEGLSGDLYADALLPLLLALGKGEISATGKLAKVRVDWPEFGDDTSNSDLTRVLTKWRSGAAFVLGLAVEEDERNVPEDLWRQIGTVWEASSLWLLDGAEQFEDHLRKLKPYPPSSADPERPYEREELACFSNVRLFVSELSRVFGDSSSGDLSIAQPGRTANVRNAGRKSKEDWQTISAFLLSKAKTEPEFDWESWDHIWADIHHLLTDPNHFDRQDTPYKGLQEWLRRNDTDSLKSLKIRIKNSPSYVRKPTHAASY